MYMLNDRSSRWWQAASGVVGGEGALDSGVIGPAVVMDVPERQEPGKLLVRAGRPGVVPVEQERAAGAVDQHVAGGCRSRWQVTS